GVALRVRPTEIHLRANVVDIPTDELDQLSPFIFLFSNDFTPILFDGQTFIISLPWMTKDIARLKVVAVGDFLQHQVLKEMLAVITQMHARGEDIRGAAYHRLTRG